MTQSCQKRVARFLKNLGPEHDTSKITILTLNAFINSLGRLNSTGTAFAPLCRDLVRIIRQSRPGVVPLHYLLDFFELDMARGLRPDMDMHSAQKIAVQSLGQRICQAERNRDGVAGQGMRFVADGDRILVHGAGDCLSRLLIRAKQCRNLDFKVMIADMYPEKTRQMTGDFRGMDYEIIGPDRLDRCLDSADKLFFGPCSVTRDKKLLAPSGTADMIRRCRQKQIRIHFFADTLHYSTGKALDQQVFQAGNGAGMPESPGKSHDLVSLDLVDHIVTEIGEISKAGHLLDLADQDTGGEKQTTPSIGFQPGILGQPEMIPA